VHLERRVAPWAEVVEAIESTRFQIESLRHGARRVEAHMITLAARLQTRLIRLHQLIWAPLAIRLEGRRRVLLVLPAQLGGVPFAALSDGSLTLSERFELGVAPSARAALRGLTRLPVPAQRVVALGETSRLPHTGREAALVASLFAENETLVGPQASIPALREAAPRADVLHLACHAQFRGDNPRFSALQLHDGPLTVESAESLPLKACTVVLSACETGLAQGGAGDEMVGLVRAFLVAGAARVVASLWAVDDELTAQFMSHFFAELARGRGPAASLRTAQALAMRAHPHPYAWAAFTLYGGW
jgi:CHAT domain-containing protein